MLRRSHADGPRTALGARGDGTLGPAQLARGRSLSCGWRPIYVHCGLDAVHPTPSSARVSPDSSEAASGSGAVAGCKHRCILIQLSLRVGTAKRSLEPEWGFSAGVDTVAAVAAVVMGAARW